MAISSLLSCSCVTALIIASRQMKESTCCMWPLKVIRLTAWLTSKKKVYRSNQRTKKRVHLCTGLAVLALTLQATTCSHGESMSMPKTSSDTHLFTWLFATQLVSQIRELSKSCWSKVQIVMPERRVASDQSTLLTCLMMKTQRKSLRIYLKSQRLYYLAVTFANLWSKSKKALRQ